MEHFYNKVEGWFEPSDKLIYDRAVNRYNDGDIFVEIGSYKGRSSSAMAVNIINSKKKIKFYCVDTWEGSEEHKNNKEVIDKTLYSLFVKNTKPVYPLINPIKKLSKQAANDFEDKKLSFVYIDASHDYKNVMDDLESWYPKIKDGGTLAGHDWKYKEVQLAILDFIKKYNIDREFVISNNSWEIIL
jgi:predicted O-methyltransferase YrrM